LAIPLGIVATLLAPKFQVWWFVRSVKGTANKLVSLSVYLEKLKEEPLFSPTETMLFEQQHRLMTAVHLLAYLVVLAIVFTNVWKPSIGPLELARKSGKSLVPFVLILIGSWTYFGIRGRIYLMSSSPKEREGVKKQIARLVEKLRSKIPPR
jgi:hypothetical protein